MENKATADFCIEIDFKKASEAPSRVFRTLSELIDVFQEFDRDLVQIVDPKIEPVVLLEDIESGSVKTWLRYLLKSIDDDALKKLDWNTIIGNYLVKAKYAVIKFLEGKTEIKSKEEIDTLEAELLNLAKETEIKLLPVYSPIPRIKLLNHIEKTTTALSYLSPEDKAVYKTREGSISFNTSFKFVPDTIEELLTREITESTMTMILKVKKPDYLGDSMWEFKHENKIIPAKILDLDWLRAFQNREVDVRPGDSIKADVKVITKYDYDFDVLSMKYSIQKVIEVIPLPTQNALF